MRKPFSSTAWLVHTATNKPTFVGTCFAFRRSDRLLTAAHCVRDHARESLAVCIHGAPDTDRREIEEIVVHPTADIAILRIPAGRPLDDRFAGDTNLYDWGMPVSAFGYPEDTGESGLQPTPRYFRGNIQRMFTYSSRFGYSYQAAELSFAAPGGLSGGPVTPDSDYSMAMGLVAENITSTRYLYSIGEETAETTRDQITEKIYRKETVHSVIDYAIVVLLDPLVEWLDKHVPYPTLASNDASQPSGL